MDIELQRLIALDTPKLNPDLANGLATAHMPFTEKWIDDVLRTAAVDFPPGLVYEGYARCTPREEYRQAVKKRNTRRGLKKTSKSTYETARSDIYLMKYFFRYNGEACETRYLYLPFVGAAGSITISGSRFNISPVLSDKVISIPGPSSIFVRLLRDKFTFNRLPYSYKTNDDRRETVQVVYGQLYHPSGGKNKVKPAVNAQTTAAHYLFAKYGVQETFKKFAGFEPVIVDRFVRSEWDEEDWVICESMKVPPKAFSSRRVPYEATKLAIIIPKHHYTPMTKSLVAAFYYVVDHFPSFITPEFASHPQRWRLAMAHMLFPAHINHGRLMDDVGNHIESLDEYIDPIVRAKMAEINVNVLDMYEFLAFILENFDNWIFTYADKINSMYDKELSVLYYVLYDITSAIFKTHFKLKAAAKKGLSLKEVNTIINSHLKTGLIYGITKKSPMVSSNTYSGDNKTFKITGTLVPQSSSSNKKNKNGDRAAIQDPSKEMHVSIAEHGAYSAMPKSEPTGRGRINHASLTNASGAMIRNPATRSITDETEQLFKA